MKTEIYLLRHGESELNKEKIYFGHLNPPLTKKGEESISTLKDFFYKDIDVVISSDLKRCYQSSLLFNKNINIKVDTRLRELNFGIFEGHSYEELNKKFPKESNSFFKGNHKYVIPKGESINMLFDRCIDFFLDLLKKYKGKRILISTHGGPIRALLAYCLANNRSAYWKFFIPHASITKLVHEDNFIYMEYMSLTNKKGK